MKLLYKPKYIKEYSLVKILMPSLLGIILCITCLMGTTWAWFTDNVTASMQSIKAADYSIAVHINDGEKLEDGKYSLSQKTEGKGYKVTVKANGSASSGYFRVSGPDGFQPLYSTQIAPGEEITFTFYPAATGEYFFESAWGTYGGEDTIDNSDVIGTPVQSEENIDAAKETEDTEISNSPADSTSAPDEEENSDKELNEASDGKLNETSSAVQPTEVPDNPEENSLPNLSNENSNPEESIEQPTMETAKETVGNTEQDQE